MNLKILLFTLFALPITLCSQSENNFADKINECYAQEKFQNVITRLQHEGECFEGFNFPNFSLKDLDGELVSNAQLQDKVVLINFWFTACPPCIKKIPDLNQLRSELDSEKVVFLAPSSDNEATIRQFFKQRMEFNSTIIPNASDFFRQTLASKSGYPTTIILDKKGVIRAYNSLKLRSNESIKAFIEELLNET